MDKVIERLGSFGIVPVVTADDEKKAQKLGQALCGGGLACAEITLRCDGALDVIREMGRTCPDMLVGAGTVLSIAQADAAVEAGAKFIVSPGLNPKVVKYCTENHIPVIPGTATPSEMELAMELGLDVVKFFPAQPMGGLAFIKAVAAPYTNLKFMPTGGLNPENVADYLKYDRILACGGSWIAPKKLIDADDFEQIRILAEEACRMVHSIRDPKED